MKKADILRAMRYFEEYKTQCGTIVDFTHNDIAYKCMEEVVNMLGRKCESCKHSCKNNNEYPCVNCCEQYISKYKPKGDV